MVEMMEYCLRHPFEDMPCARCPITPDPWWVHLAPYTDEPWTFWRPGWGTIWMERWAEPEQRGAHLSPLGPVDQLWSMNHD